MGALNSTPGVHYRTVTVGLLVGSVLPVDEFRDMKAYSGLNIDASTQPEYPIHHARWGSLHLCRK